VANSKFSPHHQSQQTSANQHSKQWRNNIIFLKFSLRLLLLCFVSSENSTALESEVFPTNATLNIFGCNLQPKMGAAYKLIAAL
jgi:hypothetical protein